MTEVKVEVKTVVEKVVLELTEAELTALYLVLRRVGGNPKETARGLIENIYCAINHAIPELYGNAPDNICEGTINFTGNL